MAAFKKPTLKGLGWNAPMGTHLPEPMRRRGSVGEYGQATAPDEFVTQGGRNPAREPFAVGHINARKASLAASPATYPVRNFAQRYKQQIFDRLRIEPMTTAPYNYYTEVPSAAREVTTIRGLSYVNRLNANAWGRPWYSRGNVPTIVARGSARPQARSLYETRTVEMPSFHDLPAGGRGGGPPITVGRKPGSGFLVHNLGR